LAAFEFVELVARAYASLAHFPLADPETCLGGRFLYAGELDDTGRALLIAANVAGAATLAATADRAAQKQALRDGVADFLVNSFDESLRILKNQLRKRETASVCVALAPEPIEREMRERGVVPDLLRTDLSFKEENACATALSKSAAVVAWWVAAAPAQWLPRLDTIALGCLEANAGASRRWLRLSPRYLGRLAQGLRLLHCDREFAARFTEQVRQRIERGEILVAVEIRSNCAGEHDEHRFVPGRPISGN
jgi:urocanate hydratase